MGQEDHERRLAIIEEPYWRRIDTLKIWDEYYFQMIGQPMLIKKNGEDFRYVIPREALTLATEEALERGLLTKIQIGTKQNIRSLTSIKLTFNNGRRDYISPLFGVNDEEKSMVFHEPVKHILGCHFRDHTCFVCFNEDLELSHGASRNDVSN